MDFETYKARRLQGFSPEEAYQEDGGGFSAGAAIRNIPSSAGRFFGGAVGALAHPVQTTKALGAVAAGGIEKLIPGRQREEAAFDSLTDFYKTRYGSFDSFLTTLEKDPVGVLSDVSVILTGGGALVSKLGTVSKLGQVGRVGERLTAAGSITNPLTAVGKLASATKAVFPKLSQVLEKSSLRLTRTKEGALATEGIIGEGGVNIAKGRLNEVAGFLGKQKIIGNPLERYAKATNLYNKTEDVLDGFFGSIAKNAALKEKDVIRSLNGLKAVYKGHRDIEAIEKQIDSAIRAVQRASDNGKITHKNLNQLKRTTYGNAYNKAGEKVVDGVEHSIGDAFRGILDENLRGLKVAGQSFEEFNHNYGLLIESRKLLKMAVGKPEISALTERLLGGSLGYLVGAFGGASTGGLGALTGLALGKQLFEALPVTKVRSLLSAGAQTAAQAKLPEMVKGLKAPLTAAERVLESQD
jgi:hypothetical protein